MKGLDKAKQVEQLKLLRKIKKELEVLNEPTSISIELDNVRLTHNVCNGNKSYK